MHAKHMPIHEYQMSQMAQTCQETDNAKRQRQAPGEGKQGDRKGDVSTDNYEPKNTPIFSPMRLARAEAANGR